MSDTTSIKLPQHLLYATSARIGGHGLDSVAHETITGAYRAGILGRAIGYDNRQTDVPDSYIRSLRWHPVRLASFLDRPYYYGAKKHYAGWIASKELMTGRYDLLHTWSGDSLRALRVAKEKRIPSLIEIPTWHRDKGSVKPRITKSEQQELENTSFTKRLLHPLLVSRQHYLEEYDLADVILVLSEKAKETFTAVGIPEERLFKLGRGVDATRFTPAEKPPEIFRAIFVGALIKRKGVHHLLQAWHTLNLPDAELILVGTVHDEIKPYIEKYQIDSVKIAGFVQQVETLYQQSFVQIFPSSCEGSAKSIYEGAACGLPQITTRESGDVIENNVNGLLIPPDNVEALTEAIKELYHHRDRAVEMGRIARQRILESGTWDHFRKRVLEAYRIAMSRA